MPTNTVEENVKKFAQFLLHYFHVFTLLQTLFLTSNTFPILPLSLLFNNEDALAQNIPAQKIKKKFLLH